MRVMPFPRRKLPMALLLVAPLAVAGCGEEAGQAARSAEFGTATMNNQLVQTCAAGTVTDGKYTSKLGGCPGSTLDGKYAQVTYEGYVASAAPEPEIVRSFEN